MLRDQKIVQVVEVRGGVLKGDILHHVKAIDILAIPDVRLRAHSRDKGSSTEENQGCRPFGPHPIVSPLSLMMRYPSLMCLRRVMMDMNAGGAATKIASCLRYEILVRSL